MGGRHRLRKRVQRYIGAAIAAAVTTFVAMNAISKAQAQSCTLRDATNWQLALADSQMEQSPSYIRGVTEAFLQACPNRPEYSEASRVAGMAAADMGDAPGAARHFRNAGRMTGVLENFYAVASFLAAGDDRTAWRTRDYAVEAWRSRLERHPKVAISAEPNAHGMIYQIYYSDLDRNTGTRAAWVAVPYGPGWPASLSFSSDRMRLAMRRAAAGDDTPDIRYVDLHRCQGRRTLGRIEKDLSTTDFDAAARASLTAYLANPDQPRQAAKRTLELCTWPARILPGTPKVAH